MTETAIPTPTTSAGNQDLSQMLAGVDLTKLSDPDFEAVRGGDLSQMSPEGFQYLREATKPTPSLKDRLIQGIGYAAKPFQYVEGLGNTAFAHKFSPIAQVITGEPLYKQEDFLNAVKGNAPTPSEFAERTKIPTGPTVSEVTGGFVPKESFFNTNPRNVAANLASASLNPANAVPVLNPLAKLLKSKGLETYASGFKNIDEYLKELGKPKLSETLINAANMPVVGMKGARKTALQLQRSSGKELGNIYGEAAKEGVTVDMLPAAKEAMEMASEMRASPDKDVVAAAGKLDDLTEGYLSKGNNVPIDEAMRWASEANRLAGKKVFDPMTAIEADFKSKGRASIGTGIQKQGRQEIGEWSPEAAQRVSDLNKTFASTREAAKPLRIAAKAETKKNPITLVDAMMGGASLGAGVIGHDLTDAAIAAGALGIKKGMEFLNYPYGRALSGKTLYGIGENVPLDAAMREAIIQSQNKSPWSLMENK